MSERLNEFNSIYREVRPLLLDGDDKILSSLEDDKDYALSAVIAATGSTCDEFKDYLDAIEEEYEIDEDDIDSFTEDTAEEAFKAIKQYPYHDVLEFIALTGLYAMKAKGFDCSKLEEGFGYVDCLSGLTAYFNAKSRATDIANTYKELQGIARDVSFEEYVDADLYIDDIKHVQGLFKRVEVESANVDTFIELGEIIREIMIKREAIEETLEDRLSYIMGSSFALNEYLGVWTGDINAPVVSLNRGGNTIPEPQKDYIHGRLNDQVIILEPFEIFRKDVFPAFFSRLGIHFDEGIDVCYSRCFDFNLIADKFLDAYTSGDDSKIKDGFVNIKPVYFPYKMLEIIEKYAYVSRLNKKSTGAKDELVYRTDDELKADKICDVSTYVNYVVKEMEREINYFLGVRFVRYIRSYKLDWFDTTDFTEDSHYVIPCIKFLTTEYGAVSNTREAGALADHLQAAVSYCVDCMTTCITLYKETLDVKETAHARLFNFVDFYFKFCIQRDVPVSASTNEMVIKNILGVGDKFGEINSQIISYKDKTGRFVYYDLIHVVNQEYVSGIPLFAYHAIDTLRNRSTNKKAFPISWNNILIGKAKDDSLVFANSDSEIPLQKNTLHIIHAGSRSGKGVMCYNIFATAVASKVPIFYLDRKPDTIIPLLNIGSEMYGVNGGDDAELSKKGLVDIGSNTISRLNNPIIAPPYLDHLSDKEKYDFVYLRAFLLVRQMMAVREEAKNTAFNQHYDSIIGKDSPLIMVVDEISNYLSNASVDALIRVKAVSTDAIKNTLSGKSDEIRKLKDTIAKEEAKEKGYNQSTVDMAQEKLDGMDNVDPEGIYWRAVYNAHKSVVLAVADKVRAAGSLSNHLHTFVIGQDTRMLKQELSKIVTHTKEGWSENPLPNDRPHATMLYTGSFCDLSPFVRIFYKTGGIDYFLGYSKIEPWYLGQNYIADSKELLNESKRYFAYRKGSFNPNSLGYLEDPNGDVKYVRGWKFVKPFVILNDATMPDRLPADGEDPQTYIDEMQLVSNTVGQSIGQSYRAGVTPSLLISKNKSEDNPECINEAVGFEGYVKRVIGDGDNAADLWNEIQESLNKSGRLMDAFIEDYYGYTCGWRYFLHNLNPEYVITFEGEDKATGTNKDVKKRLASTFFLENILMYDVPSLLGGSSKLGDIASLYGGNLVDTQPDVEMLYGGQEPIEASSDSSDILDTLKGEPNIDYDDENFEGEDAFDTDEDDYDSFDTADYAADVEESDVSSPFGTPMGLNFGDTSSVEPTVTTESVSLKDVTDMAFETLCGEVIKKVSDYVRSTYGDTVANSEGMIAIIHKYAVSETTAYLQEGGR